jgi:hypothetical protein
MPEVEIEMWSILTEIVIGLLPDKPQLFISLIIIVVILIIVIAMVAF